MPRSVPLHHVLHQGPMLATLGKTAWASLRKRNGRGAASAAPPVTPTAEITRTAQPLPRALVEDYVRHVGGDPRAYKDTVPAHLFPQWAMPVAAATLSSVSYPLTRVLNGGCRMQINATLPLGEPLHLRGWLQSVDDDGKRALLQERVVTGTRACPEALVTDFFAYVPLQRDRGAPKKEKPRVPADAREVAFFHLGKDAGYQYAKLTGDFNPIHWIPAAAKAAGFPSVVLHGFATLARATEALQRGVLGGDVRTLRVLDVRFTRPLALPHDVGVYVRNASGKHEVYVGDAAGGPAYMTGTYQTGEDL